MKPSVVYLGHQIDSNGLSPVPEKVRAVKGAPTPRNVSELKSYLGLLTYYSKFLPNLSCSSPTLLVAVSVQSLAVGTSGDRSLHSLQGATNFSTSVGPLQPRVGAHVGL